MNEIQRQVARAGRRLLIQQFLNILPWTLFGTLLIAAGALAIPKVWFLEATNTEERWLVWQWSWLGGAVALGVVIAAIVTAVRRTKPIDAAIELDRRFGLKERVSSSLSLTDSERESEAGVALLNDAARRVTQVDVGEKFRVAPDWTLAMPLVPAILAGLLVFFVANADAPKTRAAANSPEAVKKQIKKVNEELQKKIEEQKKKLDEQGLDEAKELFNKLQQGLEKMNDKDKANRENALVKLNELAQDLEKRRQELGGTDKLRQQLDQLKNIEKGPADKIGKAMQDGDFKQAMQEMQKLKDQLAKGELNEEQKQQLAKQMEQMQKKLQEMADAHEQAKRELEEQIRQKEKAGDLQEAAKLQQKLDQLKQQDKQMNKLQEMANKLGQCSQCMKEGKDGNAAQQLQGLSQDLQSLQKELDELETVDQMMQEISQAKNSMGCKECNGDGCEACQGEGKPGRGGQGKGNKNGPPGHGLGEGRGQGERPESKTDSGFYDTKVGAKPKAGEAIRSGYADGPNVAGKTSKEVRDEISSALSTDPEPLTNQRLPKAQREQAKQYFRQYQPSKDAEK